jgi:simple sugar transport system permease protein
MRLVLERRAERSATIAIASPLIAIALTLVTMSVLFAALGKNPIAALTVYFLDPLTDSYSLQEIAVKATPLVMIAIGLSLCYLANVWNIGAEGQFLIGAVAGSWLAVKTQGTDAGPWVMPAMLVLGALGGALYAHRRCRSFARDLTSLMLVYVAELCSTICARTWRDPHGYNFPTTAEFGPVATVPILIEGSRLTSAHRPGRGGGGGDHARPHDQRIEIRVVGSARRSALCRLPTIDDDLRHIRAGRLAGIIRLPARWVICGPIFRRYGFTAIIVAFLGRLDRSGC